MGIFDRQPPIGTPENPEILEPGELPRNPGYLRRGPSRLAMAIQIISWMIFINVPVLLIDYICLWLLNAGTAPGGWPAWIALLILAVPALFFTLAAVIANTLFILSLFMILLGRPVQKAPWKVFIKRVSH